MWLGMGSRHRSGISAVVNWRPRKKGRRLTAHWRNHQSCWHTVFRYFGNEPVIQQLVSGLPVFTPLTSTELPVGVSSLDVQKTAECFGADDQPLTITGRLQGRSEQLTS